MIVLSGLRYPEDIDIKITGHRPGGKNLWRVLADGENTVPIMTKSWVAKTKPFNNWKYEIKINELCEMNSIIQNLDIVSQLKEIVPEYISKF
jgi:FlaA1/EpsC-like NDP-sugar epimerase